MTPGGLTGVGSGSIAGSVAPPPKANSNALIGYARGGAAKSDDAKPSAGGNDKAKSGDPSGNSVGVDVPIEEQSQKLQQFDAVRGRPSLDQRQQDDGQHGDQRDGSFVGCAASAAKDVVVDSVTSAYHTAKDAGGALLDQASFDGYEGHSERTLDRGRAVVEGAKHAGQAAMLPIETGKKAYKAGKAEVVEIRSEISRGDSCALGERVGTAVGTGTTVAVPGGALVRGGKVLAKVGSKDGPDSSKTLNGPGDTDEPGPTGDARSEGTDKTEETTTVPKRDVTISDARAQKKFKHAAALAVEGPYNPAKGKEFAEKIDAFVKNPNHQRIDGHYQGQPAVIYVDQASNNAVIVKPNGDYWTNWTLSEQQFIHLMNNGKLGGN